MMLPASETPRSISRLATPGPSIGRSLLKRKAGNIKASA